MIKYGTIQKKILFEAVKEYFDLTKKQLKKKFNGTGGESWMFNIIPERLRNSNFLLRVSEPAYIHDFDYSKLKKGDEAGRKKADDRYLNNNYNVIAWAYKNPNLFVRITGMKSTLRKRRRERARIYYKLVRDYGAEFIE